MKKIMNILRKFNTMALSLLFLVLLIISIVYIIDNYIPHNTNEVRVVEKNEENNIKKVLTYNKKINEYLVFNLESESVVNISSSTRAKKDAANNANTVNLIFINEFTGQQKKLFVNDQIIIDTDYYNQENGKNFKISKNIYASIPIDSNNDKKIDKNDDINLYVSDYNGDNLKQIFSNIYFYQIIDNDLILIKKYENNRLKYFMYNVGNEQIKLLIENQEDIKKYFY